MTRSLEFRAASSLQSAVCIVDKPEPGHEAEISINRRRREVVQYCKCNTVPGTRRAEISAAPQTNNNKSSVISRVKELKTFLGTSYEYLELV